MSDLISSLADSIIALVNDKPRSPTKAEIETALRLGLTFEQREILADPNGARPCCGKPDLCTRPCYHRGFHAGQKSQHNTVLGAPLMPLPYKDVDAGLLRNLQQLRAESTAAVAATTGVDHLPRADCQCERPAPHPLAVKLCADGHHNWSIDDARCLDCNKTEVDVRREMKEAMSVSQAMLDANDAIRKSAYEEEALRLERAQTLLQLGEEMSAAIKQDEQDRAAWDEQERATHKLLGYEGQTTRERLEANRQRQDALACPRCGTTDQASILFCDLHCKPATCTP